MIEIRLFATLRQDRGKVQYLDAAQLHSAADILTALDIPPAEVSILLINGFHSRPEAQVKDGDVVSLFPPVGGG